MNEYISRSPLNVLFNPNLLSKKDIWEIDIVELLNTLLKILEEKNLKDLRICGIAALSSAIILRLKVENIFNLERLSKDKRPVRVRDITILNTIKPIQIPYRIEVRYPITIENLLQILDSMLKDLNKSNEDLNIEPIDSKELDKYLITFEEVLESYKTRIYQIVKINTKLSFNEFIKDLEKIDSIRYFIAVLYLAMQNMVDIEETNEDLLITLTNI